MQLRYFVPFKAQEGVSAEFALKEKLVNIEGVAIDTSVNANKWQVPEEDLDFFVQSLQGVQLRVDHAESALMVVGKIAEAKRLGNQVLFRAEVGEEKLIEKILRNYVNHVSAQVDSDDVECSKCKRPSRKEGILVHLCPGAWEIVHKPKVRELSIVASPAYQTTEFKPVGFAAAMDESQGVNFPCVDCSKSLVNSSDDGGSKGDLQGPDNKKSEKSEVRHLSENAQQDASPHQAQGVVNVAPGESAPKQVEYQDFMDQLQQLSDQIRQAPGASEVAVKALQQKLTDLAAEVAKKATKRQLSKKLSELQEQKQQEEEGEEAEGAEAEGAEAEGAEAESAETAEARRASGKGIVAVDEIQRDMLSNYDWFKDLLKAHKQLVSFK
jgi:hypothetical protein